MEVLTADEDEKFEKRTAPYPDLSNERIFPCGIRVKALFDKECKWRLIEEFGSGCFEELQNGRLLFHADYTSRDDLISWLLTFGEKAELLEPEFLREELGETIRKMSDLYTNGNKHGHDEKCNITDIGKTKTS